MPRSRCCGRARPGLALVPVLALACSSSDGTPGDASPHSMTDASPPDTAASVADGPVSTVEAGVDAPAPMPPRLEDYQGDWKVTFSDSLGITGEFPARMTSNPNGTIAFSMDTPNRFAESPDPPEETITIELDNAKLAAGTNVVLSSRYYGTVTLQIRPDGTFRHVVDPQAKGVRIEISGTFSPQKIAFTEIARLPDGTVYGQSQFTAVPGATTISKTTSPPLDCSVVKTAANVGMACTPDTCASPQGGCIQDVCYQACVPGRCISGCKASESCVAISGVTFPGGLPFGVCYPNQVGTKTAFEKCGRDLGFCQGGLPCVGPAGRTFGQCGVVCDEDGDCPVFQTRQSKCFKDNRWGAPINYCAIPCDKEANDACPAGMHCSAAANGGICNWDF